MRHFHVDATSISTGGLILTSWRPPLPLDLVGYDAEGATLRWVELSDEVNPYPLRLPATARAKTGVNSRLVEIARRFQPQTAPISVTGTQDSGGAEVDLIGLDLVTPGAPLGPLPGQVRAIYVDTFVSDTAATADTWSGSHSVPRVLPGAGLTFVPLFGHCHGDGTAASAYRLDTLNRYGTYPGGPAYTDAGQGMPPNSIWAPDMKFKSGDQYNGLVFDQATTPTAVFTFGWAVL